MHASQIALAHILQRVGKLTEALDLLQATFDSAIKAHGPEGKHVEYALTSLWEHLHHSGQVKEEAALRRRAEKMGCDVHNCTTGPQTFHIT